MQRACRTERKEAAKSRRGDPQVSVILQNLRKNFAISGRLNISRPYGTYANWGLILILPIFSPAGTVPSDYLR
jgi:hypothetical protein